MRASRRSDAAARIGEFPSYVTELVKGKARREAMQIRNKVIVEELHLPPVKIHCSVRRKDAIKAAISD